MIAQYKIPEDPQTCDNDIKYYILIYIPEPTGTNTPEYRRTFFDSDLRIPRSAILFLSPCEYITAGTRHLLAPLLQPIPRRERCAGHICHVDISLGLTKIEARAKMSSDSVSISSLCHFHECALLHFVYMITKVRHLFLCTACQDHRRPPIFSKKYIFLPRFTSIRRMHNLKSEKNQENEKTSFDRRLFSYFTASPSCYKQRQMSIKFTFPGICPSSRRQVWCRLTCRSFHLFFEVKKEKSNEKHFE